MGVPRTGARAPPLSSEPAHAPVRAPGATPSPNGGMAMGPSGWDGRGNAAGEAGDAPHALPTEARGNLRGLPFASCRFGKETDGELFVF
mmetsp:Transcript_6537/g.16632  ORF Transcript_6537/g.16632 Transcript_6537/m.16632 type:complete len:89 (-) Transcript_6537:71-337(-)